MSDSILDKITRAFQQAAASQKMKVDYQKSLGRKIELRSFSADLATGTASNLVLNSFKSNLCRKGVAATVTCPGKWSDRVTYMVDVGKDRFYVAVRFTW